MHAELAAVANEYWDELMSHHPTRASLLGDHRFDDRLEDLSEDSEGAHRSKLAKLLGRASEIPRADLDASGRVTRDLLIFVAQRGIDHIDAGLTELHCDQNSGPHAALLRTAPQVSLPEPAHAEAIVERYRRVGTLLDQAIERFRAGIAKGRPPARINVERSLSQLDAYLASPIDGDAFVAVRGPQGWAGETKWRGDLEEAVRREIRPAFARYRDALRSEILPSARPDERSGLSWIESGEETYSTLIEAHTSLKMSPAEIHEIGLDDLQGLTSEYEEIGARALGVDRIGPVLERLRDDPALRYPSVEAIVEVARSTLERARSAMGEWFGRLPRADCIVQEVPEFLARDAPPAYYLPPAEDGSRPGIYFINTHDPQQKSRVEAEATAFHEAIPGHHLQVTIASELEGVPTFQKRAGVTAYLEGWGLYTERLADEMGLYSSDLDRLGMLSLASWRSCRLVVDTGLHAKGWSRQQAIDFMAQHTPVTLDNVVVEVDRYIGIPGQALAYRIGQREILRLRRQAEHRLGNRFDVKGFHDAILTSGPVTLPMLTGLVDQWVETGSP